MMRPILVAIGLVVAALACDEGWESFGESCYKFDSTGRNYADSEAFCIEQGGHLVSIHSDDENDFIIDKAQELSMGATWIGMDDNAEENVFTPLDGTEFYRGGFTNAEPNDWGGRGQDCSYFPFRDTFGWDDMWCGNSASFVCENAPPCQEGWIIGGEDGHCYKWFPDAVPHNIAKLICAEHNAYLVSITTRAENRFVIEEVAIPTSGQDRPPNTWIGLDDEIEEGKWIFTEEGSNGFLGRFARGEPNNGGGNQNCAWFPYGGAYRWDDVSCTANRNAVCKKPNPELQFGDLTAKTQSIIEALNNECITNETGGDNENLCEKVEAVFNRLVNDCGGGGDDDE